MLKCFARSSFIGVATALVISLFALKVSAGVILAPVSAQDVSGIANGGALENVFNQSGLQTGYVSGVTDFDSYISSSPAHAVTSASNAWSADPDMLPGFVQFDLGAVYQVNQLALWSALFGFGIDEFALSVAVSQDFSDQIDVGVFHGLDQDDDVTPQVFRIGQIGRYLLFEISSNFGAGGANIGEVAFDVNPIPLPSMNFLMLVALLSLARFKRNLETDRLWP